ncbi:MAG: phosphate ABC transporter permease PstA [Eubacteriales bacterium]|nr:phosphate ABC transporter permease PstA [Eubacteriales bacterium]
MSMKFEQIRKVKQMIWKMLMIFSALITCMILVFIIGYVLWQGLKGLSITFLTTKPSYLSGNIGILPDILNTVYMLIVSIAVLLPLGVGAAVYLSEYARNHTLVRFIDNAAEILSGIPSIIYGLVGMLFFCQFLNMQTSLLAGALTLVVMNLPTIMRTTRESLLTVPKGLREGAYGLGASKWRVVRTIVIPECLDGILTGCILSAGRMLGESAALLFTAGFAHTLHGFLDGISSSGATLTVALYVYAKEQGEFQVAFSIAVILLALAVIINLCAELVNNYYKKKRKR